MCYLVCTLASQRKKQYCQKSLDLTLNDLVRQKFTICSKILTHVRSFVAELGFRVTVAPTVSPIPGGAMAKPSLPHHKGPDMNLCLRTVPELYQKRLVVGGVDWVWDTGCQFCKEGTDFTDTPEATTCELCTASADCRVLMKITG
ncbi:hypothetical protein HJG60_009501 [Phyllostomus discolor]|uniref:Aminoacyl-tRNA synthetase class II (D/K/N) domain-containing protein n=1 Tax=Phyllostomus discolor TaxID=89673 RepID=A0A833YIZ0_9CHIR|nr:hypothetical protein HJG60_009501 [Phyllostomus discolor]